MEMYILGIDAGTEAIKAGLFDLSGQRLATGVQSYPTYFPRPGWAEQDPAEWWAGLAGAVRACLQAAAVDPAQIVGLGAGATTCTLVPVDADGQPVRRALLWMDVRAGAQADRIFASGHGALRYTLAGANAEWMPPKALWLKEREPATFGRTRYLLEFTDWIAHRLTGRMALNANTITQRWYYHSPSGGWPAGFFAAIGLQGIEERFPAEILGIGEVAGPLLSEVARELGLPAGIPVAMGGGDAFIGLLGLGVIAPGDFGVIMGSSNVLSGLSGHEFHVPGIFGSFPDALIPGLNLVEGGQVSTGSLLAWFRRNFAQELALEAERTGVSIYQLLDQEAAEIPAGSDGLVVLDYFQGNRTPHTDSLARGAIWGLTLQSSRAHVFRAIMEGIAYGLRDILDTFQQHDLGVSRVIASGGATRSPLFMQIYADVLGLPLYIAREAEASLLGAAVAAAVGAGAFPDLVQASRQMARIGGEYHPDRQRHETYRFFVGKYQESYRQLKDMMHAMSRHISNDASGGNRYGTT